MATDHISRYLKDVADVANEIDQEAIEKMVTLVAAVRAAGGRMFFIGIGGGAGNASHAVNDFRKIAGLECYAATDNVSEITARANDEGWETIFVGWLKESRLSAADALFVFSVGGGDEERKISVNIVRAVEFAKTRGATILGIVGRDGGFTARSADACLVIRSPHSDFVTPLTESFQTILWHLIVSHPDLKQSEMKWESAR